MVTCSWFPGCQDEKELVIKFMSRQVAYQLVQEEYAHDILIAAEEEIKYIRKSKKGKIE